MRRRALLRLAALTSFASACGRRRKGDPVTIRVAARIYLPMSPLFLADELGYFAAEGLRVEILPLSGSSEAIPLLYNGQIDVAFFAISPALLNAAARGARVRLVAGRQRIVSGCSDFGQLYGSRRSFPRGFDDVRQLRGKRVALNSLNGTSAFFFDSLLAAAGMTRADVKVLSIHYAEAATGVASGRLDAFLSQGEEISLTKLRSSVVPGPHVSAVLAGYIYSYVTFGRRLLDGDLSAGARFLRAFLHGGRDYVDGKSPKFLYDYARRNGLDPELARQVCRDTLALDGRVQLDDIQRFIDWCVRNQLCQQPIKAANVLDTRFLEHLHASHGAEKVLRQAEACPTWACKSLTHHVG